MSSADKGRHILAGVALGRASRHPLRRHFAQSPGVLLPMPTDFRLRVVRFGGAALVLLLMGVGECRAFLWWRDSIASRRVEKALPLGASGLDWPQGDELEEPGLAFRARNSPEDLYLRLAADGSEGRMLLSGVCRQDVTFWFLGPDRNTRVWGVRLAFSRLGPPDISAARRFRHAGDAPPGPDLEPELVLAQGVNISTAPLPPDIGFRADLSGRDRFYELRVPFQRLSSARAKSTLFDFVASSASTEMQRWFEGQQAMPGYRARGAFPGPRADGESPDDSVFPNSGTGRLGRSGARGGGRMGGARSAGTRAPEMSLPSPRDIRLSVSLAQEL